MENYEELLAISFQPEKLKYEELCSESIKNKFYALKDNDSKIKFSERLFNRARELKRKTDFQKWWKEVVKVKPKDQDIKILEDLPVQGFDFGNYEITDKGILSYDEKRGSFYVIEATPLFASKLLENIDGEKSKLEITYKLRGSWKSVIVKRRDINDNRSILMLGDYNINVNSGNAGLVVKYLSKFLALNSDKIPVVKSVGRLGWHNSEFIPYETNYEFDGMTSEESKFKAVHSKGSYEEWITVYKEARKNVIVRATLATSLASPLLQIIDGQMFMVHIWGQTELGKTVAQLLAMSVWGEPTKLINTFNATPVWIERQAAFLNSIPLALNEMQTVKTKYTNTDTLIYQLCEVQSKGRGTKDGKTEETKYWGLTILSNGEQPITEDNSIAGVKNRVLELEVKNVMFKNPAVLIQTINNNYGHAGKSLIEGLKSLGKERLKEIFHTIRKEIAKIDLMDKQVNSLTFLCMADCIANQLFDDMSVEKAFISSLAFINELKPILPKKEDVNIFSRAYEFLVSWISQNKSKFDTSSYTEFYGVIEGEYVFILPTAFNKWCNEYNFVKRMVLPIFIAHNVMVGNPKNKNRFAKRIDNQIYNFYKINMYHDVPPK